MRALALTWSCGRATQWLSVTAGRKAQTGSIRGSPSMTHKVTAMSASIIKSADGDPVLIR